MNKFYELVKNDIDAISQFDEELEDYDFSDYVGMSLSESRINKLYQLIGHYYENNNIDIILSFPYDQLSNINDQLEKIKDDLNKAEEALGEDQVNEFIDQVNEINKNDVVVEVDFNHPTKEDVVNTFNGLEKTLETTISLNNGLGNKIIKQRDILKSSRTQFSNICSKGLSSGAISFDDREYKVANEYVSDVAAAFAKYHPQAFENEEQKEELDEIAVDEGFKYKGIAKIEEYIEKLDEKEFDNYDELGPEIINSVMSYIKERNEFIKENDERAFPPLGKFLYELKSKVTEIVDDPLSSLGNDKNANFIKSFLYNPINSFTELIDKNINRLDERDLLQNRWFEDEDTNVNFNALINKQRELKNYFLNEKANYDKEASGKFDSWKERQDTNAERFLNNFKAKMNNTNINDALQNNKGGFFENLFKTTSKEYKEFSDGLSKMIEEGPQKGDLDGLNDKAEAYLNHKFKNTDVDIEHITEADIARLDSTSRGRVRLCLAVIASIEEADKALYKDKNGNINIEEFDIEGYAKKMVDQEKQKAFHENVKNDSEIENNNNNISDDNINDNNIIEKEVKI